MNHLKLLGIRIKKARTQKRLTQEDVADKANLNSSYFGRIERGEINATIDTLVAIAQALNVDVGELFQEGVETMDIKKLRQEAHTLTNRLDKDKLLILRDLLLQLSHSRLK